VFVGFRRFPGHERPLIIDSGEHDQSLSLIPWGPVSLWGPTETKVDSLESGFRVDPSDIRFLLDRLNSHLRTRVGAAQILSLRCGIRPLAVDRCYSGNEATLKISRRHRVYADPARPWISLYGGKITSCMVLAEETLELLRKSHLRPVSHSRTNILNSAIAPLREDAQTRRREDAFCCTLEDYLRRRTNISQWGPRGGLGWKNENRSKLLAIALRIHGGNHVAAEEDLRNYETKIIREFDDVISRCKAS
jgi:glycerol-3-phosphate dehydrogenase